MTLFTCSCTAALEPRQNSFEPALQPDLGDQGHPTCAISFGHFVHPISLSFSFVIPFGGLWLVVGLVEPPCPRQNPMNLGCFSLGKATLSHKGIHLGEDLFNPTSLII